MIALSRESHSASAVYTSLCRDHADGTAVAVVGYVLVVAVVVAALVALVCGSTKTPGARFTKYLTI